VSTPVHDLSGRADLSAHVVASRGAFTLDVALEVAAGEVVAVLGPNGAGKSTLLRVLAGLLALDAGRLHLGGTCLDDPAADVFVPAARRRLGVVFQDYRLFPHLSSRENVAFGLRSTGTPRAAARAAADGWLARFGLADLAGRRPAELSGGQAQRVALARALATGPQLLLLDEPLAALDTATRDDVRAELRNRLVDFPGPVLLVTHDLLDALALADRILVLEEGRVVQDDAPQRVVTRPLTPYVARLAGLNLYAGTARDGRVHLDAACGGGVLPVADPHLRGRVLTALRPGAVRLHAPDLAPAGGTTWQAEVASVQALVERVRVTLVGAPGGGGVPGVIADLDLQTAARLRLHRGQPLVVSVQDGALETYPAP
jgi:molybdate transport system ATP-binding protein